MAFLERLMDAEERAKRIEMINPLGKNLFTAWEQQEAARIRHGRQIITLTQHSLDMVCSFIKTNQREFVCEQVRISSPTGMAKYMLRMPSPVSRYYFDLAFRIFFASTGQMTYARNPIVEQVNKPELLARDAEFMEAVANCFRTKEA